MGYWEDRQAEMQAALTKKNVEQVERQIAQYYRNSQTKIIGQFKTTYNRILSNTNRGVAPVPADLYKLDTYWKMLGEVAEELRKLGDKQAAIIQNAFIMQYWEIYDSTAVKGLGHYTKLDTKAVEGMLNNIWCADGKHWSSRIWDNTAQLQETLNQNLIDCLVAGKNPDYLKGLLMESFDVSFNRADSLVRTEMAHIQTQAAQQRYIDAGVEWVQVWADKDERRCKVCGELHEKKYRVTDKLPIPAHPRCRCCVIPVVDTTTETIDKETKKPKQTLPINALGQEIKIDERFNTEKWEKPRQTLINLANEYDTRLTSIKLGANKAGGTVGMGGEMRLSNASLDTAYHEFAHSIAMEELTKYGVVDNSDFWKEIKTIRRNYRKDVGQDSSKWISSYEHSHNSVNEFMAEAFTMAKMRRDGVEVPSKYGTDFYYANQVLAVVDRYFKKK